jgi:alpha-beta hydrolase superfamily lysophospholipase
MGSTAIGLVSRRRLLLGMAAGVSGCAAPAPPGWVLNTAPVRDGSFVMRDGVRLPYRAWLPEGPPVAVVLALHGMNDSRDAWEIPGPAFAAAGIALYGPDQRGFGEAPGRGRWPGAAALTEDAATMLALLADRHPGVRLLAMGESMGGAVLMRLGAGAPPPEVAGYILVSPAVWGRAEMDLLLRSGLWLVSHTIPAMTVTGGGPIRVLASDNLAALRRLGRDRLTLHTTRFDALRGLVDLMDDALAAAARLTVPALAMYGGHDELVPKRATRAAWQRLPAGSPVRLAYYPNDYHLMLRDLERDGPIGDAVAWIGSPAAPLPSGADIAARAWLNETA